MIPEDNVVQTKDGPLNKCTYTMKQSTSIQQNFNTGHSLGNDGHILRRSGCTHDNDGLSHGKGAIDHRTKNTVRGTGQKDDNIPLVSVHHISYSASSALL